MPSTFVVRAFSADNRADANGRMLQSQPQTEYDDRAEAEAKAADLRKSEDYSAVLVQEVPGGGEVIADAGLTDAEDQKGAQPAPSSETSADAGDDADAKSAKSAKSSK